MVNTIVITRWINGEALVTKYNTSPVDRKLADDYIKELMDRHYDFKVNYVSE
jgi:hypothetical protein